MARGDPFQIMSRAPAWQGEAIELLASQIRAEDGDGGEVEEKELCYAKGILFVLDVETVSGITPTLDVAIYAKLDGWYMRLLQLAQKTATYTGGRLIRRDGASFTDAITLLDTVPTPGAASGYVKDGVPWGSTFVVSWKISGTFAIEDPGPPVIPAEGFTFSVKAIPLHF